MMTILSILCGLLFLALLYVTILYTIGKKLHRKSLIENQSYIAKMAQECDCVLDSETQLLISHVLAYYNLPKIFHLHEDYLYTHFSYELMFTQLTKMSLALSCIGRQTPDEIAEVVNIRKLIRDYKAQLIESYMRMISYQPFLARDLSPSMMRVVRKHLDKRYLIIKNTSED